MRRLPRRIFFREEPCASIRRIGNAGLVFVRIRVSVDRSKVHEFELEVVAVKHTADIELQYV